MREEWLPHQLLPDRLQAHWQLARAMCGFTGAKQMLCGCQDLVSLCLASRSSLDQLVLGLGSALTRRGTPAGQALGPAKHEDAGQSLVQVLLISIPVPGHVLPHLASHTRSVRTTSTAQGLAVQKVLAA